MKYTEESLRELCTEISGVADDLQPLLFVVNDAAIVLFIANIRCDSFCAEIRMALLDLQNHGEFRFSDKGE